MLDALSSTPKPAKIKLILHAETTLQRRYHESMESLHQGLGSYTVEIRAHAVGLAHYRIAREVVGGERALWIIQVDAEAYSAWLHNTDSSEAIFCDLSRFGSDVRSFCKELASRRSPPTPVNTRSPSHAPLEANPIRSVPYYLNPSFLLLQKDFAKFIRRTSRDSGRECFLAPIARGCGEVLFDPEITSSDLRLPARNL